MFHTIEFTSPLVAELEISPRHRLERLRIRRGMCLCAEVQPHILETDDGPIETADLFFDNRTVTREVPYSWFRFVDESRQ